MQRGQAVAGPACPRASTRLIGAARCQDTPVARPAYNSGMRALTDAAKLERFMERLGREARGPGRIYLVGGATAVLHGWRSSTVDADLKLDPEPAGVFEAIRTLKDELDMNVELAAPDDFIPPVPGWRERSPFIVRHGQIDFHHYDLVTQALAKVERGHGRDLDDVRAMVAASLVDAPTLRRAFAEIEPQLIRYPAVDPDAFRDKLESFLGELEPR
jgi:uncharacterized nucleotidyltransferase DUF6036